MFRPTIQYKIPDTPQRDLVRTLKVRNYRYLSRFPEDVSEKSLSNIHSSIKSIKIAYSCHVPGIQSAASILSLLCKTLKKLKNSSSLVFGYGIYNESSHLLISRCKELAILDSNVGVENLAQGKFRTSFRALPKLKAVKLYPSSKDFECLPVLLKRKCIKVLDLGGGEFDALPISLFAKLKLNVEEEMHHKEWLSNIGVLSLSLKKPLDQDKIDQFKKIMKSLAGLKNLKFSSSNSSQEMFKKALCPVLKDLKQLQHLSYAGPLTGPELQHFDFIAFSKQLITLDLGIKGQGICSQSFRQFASQLRSFTNLQKFSFTYADISFANEFLSDLPHSLPILKSVEFRFDSMKELSPFPLELKLHLNSFLDWIISLPNLEEVTLMHPAFNSCYCNYLENCKVLPKLKQVTILELMNIYDITLCEVEYQDIDLAAFLKVVLPETIERVTFTLHMELFKPKVLDMLEERLLQCRKLSELGICLCVNTLNEKHLLKLEKIFASLSHVRKKMLQINLYEAANGLASEVVNEVHVLKGLCYTTVNFVTEGDDE